MTKFEYYQNTNGICRVNFNGLIGIASKMDTEGFYSVKTIKGITSELTENEMIFFPHFVKQS